ncbi:MAG: DUF3606 domain-containing protein [Chitinophagaceae bacterium]|nr:MAG: DUF3606 domain-containing protein [Chitinophagaceae bacterium]
MQENEDNIRSWENSPDSEKVKERYPIEDDSDTLEPFVDESAHQEINVDDPADVEQWANQFQISVADLRAAMVLNGNSVSAIKKYLSV